MPVYSVIASILERYGGLAQGCGVSRVSILFIMLSECILNKEIRSKPDED